MIDFCYKTRIFVLNTCKDIVPCLFKSVGGNHRPVAGSCSVADTHNIGCDVSCNLCGSLVEIIHCHSETVELIAESDNLLEQGQRKRIVEILICEEINRIRIKIKLAVEQGIRNLGAEADRVIKNNVVNILPAVFGKVCGKNRCAETSCKDLDT